MRELRRFSFGLPWFVAALLLVGCGPPGLPTSPADASPAADTVAAVTSPATPSPAPATALTTPGQGVAHLLANPPAPGQSVELTAYFSGAGAPVFSRPPPSSDQVSCPDLYNAALTDRPFLAVLQFLNGLQSNTLPKDAPWLIATSPEAIQPGVYSEPQFPYHARFRGHLGNPAFAHCLYADRIFVVEDVVAVYAEQPLEPSTYQLKLPEGFAAWPRYYDADLGYSLSYPPGWSVEPLAERDVISALALRPPQPSDYPVIVRIDAGEVRFDQYAPTSVPPLLQGEDFSIFEQGWVSDEGSVDSQHLAGYQVNREIGPGERAVSVLFSANGYTYELALAYPTGFEASQSLLTIYSAIVEGFRLDLPPGPTPTPPIKQTLGTGPFLSQAEALARVHEQDELEIQMVDAQLVSEAEARRLADACNTFFGHPDGVWVLTVRGFFEGTTRTMRFFLDATSGEQLCGEEIIPQ